MLVQYSSMLVRQERIAVLLLAGTALAVIGAHLLLSGLGKQPFARPFTETSPDGELVVLEGEIIDLKTTRTGGHTTMTVNNTSLFLPAEVVATLTLRPGDRIAVYGMVQTYRGKKEIVVSAPEDLRILVSTGRNAGSR